MCLAFPGKITEIVGDFAKIDFGGGTMRNNINISYVDGQVGDYVLIHAGYAIQVLDLDEAENILKYWVDNTSWKCNQCEIINECSTGNLVKEVKQIKHNKLGSES
jgi:hydrogenase expression/formation protein HypC